MSTAIAKTEHPAGDLVVRPQSSHGISTTVESQRAIAEVQAALTVAAARPRDEKGAMERIEISCQRVGLAEKAEYSFSRGGQEITGPTIDLLTVIANQWGNVQFGFRELTQRNGESEVEAFAWDLETNSKRSVQFTVPHVRHTRQGTTKLTDPRDIYELVANNAQRRVRACLEAIIPPDVVEDATLQCRATLKEKADVTPDSINRLVEAFAKHGVTKAQIEARLLRRIDTMQPAQLVSMRRIYKSLSEGMSAPSDWFAAAEGEQQAENQTATVKEALKKRAKPAPEPEQPNALDAIFSECKSKSECDDKRNMLLSDPESPGSELDIHAACDKRKGQL